MAFIDITMSVLLACFAPSNTASSGNVSAFKAVSKTSCRPIDLKAVETTPREALLIKLITGSPDNIYLPAPPLKPILTAQNSTGGTVNAKKAKQVPKFEIAFPVLLDDRYLGDVSVLIQGESKSFSSKRLTSLLQSDITGDVISQFETSAVEGRLTIGQINVSGLSVTFNDQLQQIEVNSDVVARGVRDLNFASLQTQIQTKLEKPANFSLFINPTLTAEYAWSDFTASGKGLQALRGNIDIGGRIGGEKGVAFLSRQSYVTGANGRSGGISREETQLIYDVLPRILRATAGDLRPRGASFQSIPGIGGVSLERFFELEPNRIFRPSAKTNFELERPSSVEVRINGIVQREFFLQPGRYDLRDLPLVQGSNLVDLVIRDDTGREQIISDRNFFDFDLLEKGITDFSIAGGIKTNFGDNAPVYSDDPIVTAFARRGLSDDVTAGVDIQADAQGANGGGSVLWASPIGVWRLEGAASSRKTFGTGFAGDIGYRNSGYFGQKNWQWDANANARYIDRNFATVNDGLLSSLLTPPSNNSVSDLNNLQPVAATFNTSLRISERRLALSGASSYSIGRGRRPDTFSFIAGVNYTLSPRWSAGVFGRHISDGIETETGLSVQLNWRPARNTNVTARYDTARNEAEFRYRRSGARAVGGLSYGLNALSDIDDKTHNLSGNAFYTGNRFEATARHDVFRDNGRSDFNQISRLTVASSLVMADKKVAIGRPVRETFAILSAHSSLSENEIFVDPIESGVSAKTGLLGAAVAVDITPFSRRSIYVDVDKLPPGYDLGTGEFALRPPQFSGYNLTVGSGQSYTIIGQVTNAETGEPLIYVGGHLDSLDNPEAEPIPAFTNRNGRLAASGIKPGNYRLSLFTNPVYTKDITITEEGPNLINIGHIKVTEE